MKTLDGRIGLGSNPSIRQIQTAAMAEDRRALGSALTKASNDRNVKKLVPSDSLSAWAEALDGKGGWAGEIFQNQQFFGPEGHFVIVGAYVQRRDGGEHTALSMLAGQRLELCNLGDPRPAIHRLFRQTPEHVPTVIPITVDLAAGNVGSEAGEAFVVPDGFAEFAGAERGPALTDMGEQEHRFAVAGMACLEQIFAPETFADLRGFLEDKGRALRARATEYQLHDFGHSTGLGLETKLGGDLLKLPSNRGREEWRADGIAFQLAKDLVERPADIVRSNLATRFGIDAQRRVGDFLDTDVICAQLTFRCLRESELLRVTADGLDLIDTVDETYLQMTALMSEYAAELTRKELRLDRNEMLANLYGTWPRPSLDTELIDAFELAVRLPSRGLFASLR